MIDVLTEPLIDLKTARKHPAFKRNGKHADLSAVYRWAKIGVRSVTGEVIRLETVKTPFALMTSEEACLRFIARLSDMEGEIATPTPAKRKARQQVAISAAEKELAALGVK